MWLLASGELVADRINSHIRPEVLPILPDALLKIVSRGRRQVSEVIDFGRIIGNRSCVETYPRDRIVYAQLYGRGDRLLKNFKRFVLNRKPIPCSELVVALERSRNEKDTYIIKTAYFSDKELRKRQFALTDFWADHALVWESEKVKCFFCYAVAGEVMGNIACCNRCYERLRSEKTVRFTRVHLPGWSKVRIPIVRRSASQATVPSCSA